MADTAIFASMGIVRMKAGSGVNTTAATSELIMNAWALQAESYINTVTKYNWSDTYSTLNNDVKFILQDAASCHSAMNLICYNMDGYQSTAKAQTMLSVLNDRLEKDIKILAEIDKADFIKGA